MYFLIIAVLFVLPKQNNDAKIIAVHVSTFIPSWCSQEIAKINAKMYKNAKYVLTELLNKPFTYCKRVAYHVFITFYGNCKQIGIDPVWSRKIITSSSPITTPWQPQEKKRMDGSCPPLSRTFETNIYSKLWLKRVCALWCIFLLIFSYILHVFMLL